MKIVMIIILLGLTIGAYAICYGEEQIEWQEQILTCTTSGSMTICETDWSKECWNCNQECCSGEICNTMCFKVCNMGNDVFKGDCKKDGE